MKYGLPVLFKDVDQFIDPFVEYIVANSTNIRKLHSLRWAGKDVDIDAGFRMYLTTKKSNPKFATSVYETFQVINFSFTLSGLEEQLLAVIVKHEKPDVEERRDSLIHEKSLNKKLLKDLEDSLLRELTNSSGNMLDNVELVQTLEEAKTKATEVHEKLNLSHKTGAEIDRHRDAYRLAARRGAILYFVLTDLSNINVMYQFSLPSYLDIFIYSVKRSMADSIIAKRVRNIMDSLTHNVFFFGCTALFQEHKLLFSFCVATKLQLMESTSLSTKKMSFFVFGKFGVDVHQSSPFPWMSAQIFNDVLYIEHYFPESFKGLSESIFRLPSVWRGWLASHQPEQEIPVQWIPNDITNNVEPFDMLLLVRTFRPDRVVKAIKVYINAVLGPKYISPPIVTVSGTYEQTTAAVPILFVLSPGCDPTDDVRKLAKSLNFSTDKVR